MTGEELTRSEEPRIVSAIVDSETPGPDPNSSVESPELELEHGSKARLEDEWRLPMSDRLARLHELCKQMAALSDVAKTDH